MPAHLPVRYLFKYSIAYLDLLYVAVYCHSHVCPPKYQICSMLADNLLTLFYNVGTINPLCCRFFTVCNHYTWYCFSSLQKKPHVSRLHGSTPKWSDMILMIHQWQRNYSALDFQEKRYIKTKLLLLLFYYHYYYYYLLFIMYTTCNSLLTFYVWFSFWLLNFILFLFLCIHYSSLKESSLTSKPTKYFQQYLQSVMWKNQFYQNY